jgi:predicted nucleic acid-binding protein
MKTIDANIILRFLTNDLPDQANRAASLLQRLEEHRETVFLPDLILADIIWVLEGYYHYDKISS